MHAIFIRGRNEPIIADDLIGREIKDRWVSDTRPDEKVELEGVSFNLKSIYRVENNWLPSRDRAAEISHNKQFYSTERREYDEYIRNLRAQSPEIRARNLSLPQMVWYAITEQREIPAEAAERIIERQRYYFLDNPADAYASPVWYRDLIPMHHDGYQSALRPMRHQSRDNAFLLAERVLQASYRVR
jgi:hypothetical protein